MPPLEIAAPAQATAVGNAPLRRWSHLAVGLFALAFWMLQDPYDGLIHDGVLYAFSALARLHPGSLGHDIMLTLGTQDKFTVFSPIAAAVFSVFGLEHGAALLTCLMFAAFIVCCWLLARRVMSVELAVLAVGLIIVLPSEYGSGYLFGYVEPFMTPRPAAEAAVLAAIAAALGGRYALCAFCMLGSLLLHGIMAAAGVAFLIVMYLGLRRPRLTLAIALCGFAAIAVAAFALPFGPISRLDPWWLNVLRTRLAYLFPTLWHWQDWSHAAIPFAVLAVGMFAVREPPGVRRLCAAAAITGLAGVALSIVGSDLLHITVIAQAQTWRWLWLTNALAVLLLVPIGVSCWKSGYAGRTTVILVAASWVAIDEPFAVLPALLAVLSAAAAARIRQESTARLIFRGACAILLLSFVAFCGSVLAVTTQLHKISPDSTLYTSPFLLALRPVRAWASGGVLTAALLIAVSWLSVRKPSQTLALLVTGVVLCAAVAPLAWHAWSRVTFTDSVRNDFAGWRAQMPEDAQVLWVDSTVAPWFALGRPSYWSLRQMAGLVFSRPLTSELVRRETLLTRPRTRAESSHSVLDYTCATNPMLDYVVSPRDLGPTPFAPVSIETDSAKYRVLLYRCADHRG